MIILIVTTPSITFGVVNTLATCYPYTTYHKEQKRKFKNDLTKSQNWQYNAKDDYYIDHLEVCFSFYRYSKQTNKN